MMTFGRLLGHARHPSLPGWILGLVAIVVPDKFAIPILILFLSGAITFVGWLVKTNQQTARIAARAADRLEDLYDRVDDLEKWRVIELTNQRDNARKENKR